MILDGPLIRRRRQDLALSQRELSRRLGVSPNVVSVAEEGTNHDTLSLGLVVKLATVLAVSVSELIVDATEDAPTSPDDLAKAIGSLLLETQALTAIEAIADALDLTLPATDAALTRLEQSLPSVGMVLHRLNGDVTIRSQATTDPGARKRLHRKHQARRGLSLTEARVLYRVAQGRIDEGKLSNPDGVALNRLRRAGLVTDGVCPALTEDAAVGLRL